MSLHRVLLAKPRSVKVKVGWMANTREQVAQAYLAISYFPALMSGIDFKAACAAADTDWSDRDVLIVDEAHHAATAESWLRQILTCRGALWGFTATPPEADDIAAHGRFNGLFNEMFVVTREDVAHAISKATVTFLNASDPGLALKIDAAIDREKKQRSKWWRRDEVNDCNRILINRDSSSHEKHRAAALLKAISGEIHAMCSWQKIVEIGFVQNHARNAAAVSYATSHPHDSILLLVNQIEHGEQLCAAIPGAKMFHSKLGAKVRRETLEAFKSGQCRVMVASSAADEGMDCPRCNVVIMVSGGRSSSKTEQRSGRALRIFVGKTGAKIIDFSDLFHPLARKHSNARLATYRKLGYEISGLQSEADLL